MSKQKILGLDIGSNSIGWALLQADGNKMADIIAAGSRIFPKSVENKTPTPKNVARRNARLSRRVLQRRKRRKLRMTRYLVKLNLLPDKILSSHKPEEILNNLGCPYALRAKGLDSELTAFEFGRVLLNLVQRRGFLSNRKTILGDMADDPDVKTVLEEQETNEEEVAQISKEETAFKKDISELRRKIKESNCRTLGEYLSQLDHHSLKRNRTAIGGNLRTDREMYRDELDLIWDKQSNYFSELPDGSGEHKNFISEIKDIIFKQRPLKLNPNRVGKCSLERKKNRARMGRLEVQKFRYWQDINNLQFLHPQTDKWTSLNEKEKQEYQDLCETKPKITKTDINNLIGLGKGIDFNLETKNLKGNTTSAAISILLPEWKNFEEQQKNELVEDLITYTKKSKLKERLINHWNFETEIAVNLCLLELEPGHSNLSSKAIKKLLPFLTSGQLFSEARVSAGYGYEKEEVETKEKLSLPPETSNPIVNRGLNELRRVVNAVIAEFGKPDVIRIEMARDLEMNTQRYKKSLRQQEINKKANEDAVKKFKEIATSNQHLGMTQYPSRDDKVRYRLWKDQDMRCAYSGESINEATLFSAEIDVDHIVPYSQSLDDSYMNKVVCYARENKQKGQKTPIDAFGGELEKWEQITQRLKRWKGLERKVEKFYMNAENVLERDFINNQLNDTRYISKLALEYVAQLGVDVTATKGFIVSWLRHQWGLNSLIGETDKKERTDHRHHAIDAIVISVIDRNFHRVLAKIAKDVEKNSPEFKVRDLKIDPPFEGFESKVAEIINSIVVSHKPDRKLSGALHEDTGIGFNERLGVTIYRKNLDEEFTVKKAEAIIDDSVKELVVRHLEKHQNKPKQAFSKDNPLFHKDGVTQIKRVRLKQSKTSEKKLKESKFGVKDKEGNEFKWMTYGNTHHVELLRHKKTGKIVSKFVTMMEAAHRARGINCNRQPLVEKDHGDDYEFLFALHSNEMVSLTANGVTGYYRVVNLDAGDNRASYSLHNISTGLPKPERFSFNKDNFEKFDFKKVHLNILGKEYD